MIETITTPNGATFTISMIPDRQREQWAVRIVRESRTKSGIGLHLTINVGSTPSEVEARRWFDAEVEKLKGLVKL